MLCAGLPGVAGRGCGPGFGPLARLRATWLAELPRTCWGWPRSCTRPGSAAPSGSATCSPGWSQAARPRRSRLLGAARPAMIPLAVFEEIIDASGVAPRIEAMLPIGVRAPAADASAPCWPACCLTQADHRPAHLTRVHQALTSAARRRPAAARRDRGLEARPAPADLPADRAHLRPGRRRARQGRARTGCPRGPLQRVCDDLLEASIPEQFKDASTSLAVDWTDLESFSRPPPRGTSALRRPRGLLGTPQEQPAAQPGRAVLRLLPVGRDHDAARSTARPSPSSPAAPPCRSCRHDPVRALVPVLTAMPAAGHPARRHPRRLRLRPPRRRRLGPPAPPGRRAARPGPAPARPRPQGHPPRRHHRQRQPVLPAHTPHRCWNSGRSPATPPASRPPPTTARPPNSPATSSAASPPTTPTATTASPAPPPWARSAARSGPPR